MAEWSSPVSPAVEGLGISGVVLPRSFARLLRALRLHRIRTTPSARAVSVVAAGRVLASSERAVELRETGSPVRFYVPRADVRVELTRSATTTRCPFKGEATYWSTPELADAFWSYEAPTEADVRPIAGLLAPDPGRVTVELR